MNSDIFSFQLRRKIVLGITEYAIYIALFALILVFTFLSPSFLTGRNISGMILNNNHLMLTAIGMAFVLLTGMIDLSVGSIAYVAMAIAGTLMRDYHIGLLPGLLVCLLVGIIIGLINGILVVKLKLNPMLITLGMMIGLRGLGLQITQSLIIEMSRDVQEIVTKEVFGLPIMIILTFILILIVQVVLSLTCFGKHVIAIGCNEKAARNQGIRVDLIKLVVMVVSGFFAALAGFYCSANLGTCLQSLGNGWEFSAISIAVLGGVSLSGGIGRVFPGVLVGFLIIVIVENGMSLLGVTPYLLPIIRGIVIFLAMFVDSIKVKHINRLAFN